MNTYEDNVAKELTIWHKKMKEKPTLTSKLAKKIQTKVNSIIPEKAHEIITNSIKNMVKVVFLGSEITSKKPIEYSSLDIRDGLARESLEFYKKAATVSGAGTGAGGIIVGLADFPILLSIKLKFLYEVAGIYGFDIRDYKERLYILNIFSLAFSSPEKRIEVYDDILHWDKIVKKLPSDLELYDWKSFQQEYRDYIDLAKMFQLVPLIGAAVGAYANYKLMDKLGETAMNAYRLRLLDRDKYWRKFGVLRKIP